MVFLRISDFVKLPTRFLTWKPINSAWRILPGDDNAGRVTQGAPLLQLFFFGFAVDTAESRASECPYSAET